MRELGNVALAIWDSLFDTRLKHGCAAPQSPMATAGETQESVTLKVEPTTSRMVAEVPNLQPRL